MAGYPQHFCRFPLDFAATHPFLLFAGERERSGKYCVANAKLDRQWCRQGLEPEPLNPESSTLDIRLLRRLRILEGD